MKVLTIKQPYASLIAEGLKRYEFHTWKTNYRGDFLIHAGKGVDKEAMKRLAYLDLDYPQGCILAKVTLTDCVQVDEDLRDKLQQENSAVYAGVIEDKTWQGYGFQLNDIQKIEPVFINGKLGFWEYNEKI